MESLSLLLQGPLGLLLEGPLGNPLQLQHLPLLPVLLPQALPRCLDLHQRPLPRPSPLPARPHPHLDARESEGVSVMQRLQRLQRRQRGLPPTLVAVMAQLLAQVVPRLGL